MGEVRASSKDRQQLGVACNLIKHLPACGQASECLAKQEQKEHDEQVVECSTPVKGTSGKEHGESSMKAPKAASTPRTPRARPWLTRLTCKRKMQTPKSSMPHPSEASTPRESETPTLGGAPEREGASKDPAPDTCRFTTLPSDNERQGPAHEDSCSADEGEHAFSLSDLMCT